MKILIIYQYFGTPAGSWSTRVYEFSRRWVEHGNEVTVITSPYEKSDIKAKGFITKDMVDGISLIILNTGDSNRNSVVVRVLKALVFSFLSVLYALILKYDLILSSSGPITVGIPMILAKKLRGKKTTFEVRDLWPGGGIEMGKINKKWQQKLALWFEKKCYLNADLIVTASPGQKNDIISRFKDINTIVIPQASDIELFSRSKNELKLPDWAKGKKIFSHIGSLGYIHNVQFIIDSLKYLKVNEEIIIVLVGEGAEREQLEGMVKHNNLGKKVKFMGLLPKTEVVEWVNSSVATLFTTLDNPIQNTSSPNKIFDSFAAGIPIIQTTTGWIKDLVDKEKCGINTPPGNQKAFAEAIKLLSENLSIAKELGMNAKKIAVGEFNRDKLAKKYLDHLMSI